MGRRGPHRHPQALHHNLLARLCRLSQCAPGLHNAGTALPDVELGAGSPLRKAHATLGGWQAGIGYSWLAWGHYIPACPVLHAEASPKMASTGVLLPGRLSA